MFKNIVIGCATLLALSGIATGVTMCNVAGNMVASGVQVAQQEFNPAELLRKYEWFKDTAASLEKTRANIQVYEGKVGMMMEDYSGVQRKDWPRSDREALNIYRQELSGITASYNMVASEYNSAMSKFNWSLANKGALPAGAQESLPREVKQYIAR